MSFIGKNIHEIPDFEVFLEFYILNFTTIFFTWGLANDLHIYKKNMKNLQNISFCLFDLRNNTKSNLQGESQCKSITISKVPKKFQ